VGSQKLIRMRVGDKKLRDIFGLDECDRLRHADIFASIYGVADASGQPERRARDDQAGRDAF